MPIDIDNRTKLSVPEERIRRIAEEMSDKEIELLIVDEKSITELNRMYRNIDKATDVLSFPLENEGEHMPLGSIVVSASAVVEGAKRFGHTTDDEFVLLFIHGLLHLLGYDHETDNGEMRREEERLIRRYDLPESLIVRTDTTKE